jgi:hypothetical protein
MAERQSKEPLIPEVVRADSRPLERLEEQPLRLSLFAMRQRKLSLERENELVDATAKNQEARLRLLRAAERLREDRLNTILMGDAAKEANEAGDEIIKAELAEERASTAKLRERSEQARLRAEIAENEARLARAKGKLDNAAKSETLVEKMFRAKLGRLYTEQDVRTHAAQLIAEIHQRAGDGPLSESMEREIKNVTDVMNDLLNEL